MRENKIFVEPGLYEHFLIKLKYYLRCLTDMPGGTPTETRSREPACFEPFPPYLVRAVSSQLLTACLFVDTKRVLMRHSLRIVKLPRRRRRKKDMAQMTPGFKCTFFANFKSSIKSSSPWESSKIACKQTQNMCTEHSTYETKFKQCWFRCSKP